MQRSAVGGGAARECGADRVREGLVLLPTPLSADAGLSGEPYVWKSLGEEPIGARLG